MQETPIVHLTTQDLHEETLSRKKFHQKEKPSKNYLQSEYYNTFTYIAPFVPSIQQHQHINGFLTSHTLPQEPTNRSFLLTNFLPSLPS